MSKDLIFGSGVSACKDFSGLKSVCKVALENGITWFDTAPSYKTEELISRAVHECSVELGLKRDDYFIQTKIDPIQMYNGNIEEYFYGKLKAMNLDYVDSLLIHWPVRKYFLSAWESICKLKEKQIVRKVGICNLRIRQLNELNNIGIMPEIVQVERHPLNTFQSEMAFCKSNGINVQDYSPLCKMHERLRNNPELIKMAERHGKNIGQIILRWHIDTGATPIFTSTKPARVKLYSEIFDFTLSEDEVRTISSLNCNHKLYLESLVCPGF